MAYNGHKNWNHWNVSLWIGNDEGLYRAALDALKSNNGKVAHAAHYLLAELQDLGIEKTPDGAKYSVLNIAAALRGLS
jgi:hypothetical protein